MISMADKIIGDFVSLDDITGGDIYFGLAESYQIRYLAQEIKRFKEIYPRLRYHISSGEYLLDGFQEQILLLVEDQAAEDAGLVGQCRKLFRFKI